MIPKLPRQGSVAIIRILEQHGFAAKRQTGSHKIFFNPDTRKVVTVPVGKKDLPIGTLKSIIRQSGIDVSELYR